ncbi:MAG: ATP-dependent helicase HrpB [Actinobacteria bacterium]|nr:ATP-dependent helicase HrpB [Actinomycetota bacterium]
MIVGVATAPQVPDTGLPVEAAVAELRAALAGPGHAVLVAEPGAGKTTVVPLRLLDEPWLDGGRIVVLEPRRLAARAAARRMAELLGEPVGRTVGYRTRDERVGGRDVRIEVITEGILVRRLQADPELPGTGLVVLDEVHERNLTTDLSLALVLDVRRALRPDLRVLAMSATLDTARFAAIVGGEAGSAPVVSSPGRTFPVEVRWRPPGPRDRLDGHVARVVAEALATEPDGDVLVFLPGVAEIERVRRGLTLPGHVVAHPLHGSLPVEDQDRALAPSAPGRRRVVLATDIAESSLTVAGVRVVVDAGRARVPRYEASTGRTGLVTVDASRASADQRAGRAGRLGPGVAYRLWAEHDHLRRPAHPEPEIAQVDLAGFALELSCWGARPDDLALPDQPPAAAWQRGVALLHVLGAIDGDGRPTATGRELVRLPLSPRAARMLVAARDRGIAWTGAVTAAVVEERDVLGGRRDDRHADLVERVRVVGSSVRGRARSAPVDRLVEAVRRRARELHRRAGGGDREEVDGAAVAALVAGAFPDRIAQARGGGRFRLRSGGGGWLPEHDPLAGAAFLAVAEVDVGVGDGRIRLAVGLDEDQVGAILGDEVERREEVRWDDAVDNLRVRVEERVDALVLRTVDRPAGPGPATVDALLERVRATGGNALPWSAKARDLQHRVGFLRSLDPDRWPALDDETLLATLDDWLAPHLVGATGRAALAGLDLAAVLGSALSWEQRTALDREAPAHVATAGGRDLPVRYADAVHGAGPSVEARAQDLYGTTVHPTVAGGRVPIVVRVLSPAGRPVQVTADLPGFWSGSWSEVRKEMAGRYPKHDWPTDPAVAPPRSASRRGS